MEDEKMELPPGFRFHPTDAEIITHYLSKKVLDSNFSAKAMGEVDLNKVEPWDLPWNAKMGEKEWYFFCLRDKKYPTGLRTNRATAAGYWKATGRDKDIFQEKRLVGMKKTLVFYKGRAPKGERTNWVMHEYRLDGKFPLMNLPSTAKNEWVICRVFEKNANGKKIHYQSLNSIGTGISSVLPPLKDYYPSYSVSETMHVSCFSNPIEIQKNDQKMTGNYINNPFSGFSSNQIGSSLPNSFVTNQVNLQYYPSSVSLQEHVILKGLMESYGSNSKQSLKADENRVISVSQEAGFSGDMNTNISSDVSNINLGSCTFKDYAAASTSLGGLEFDHAWNY